MALLRRLLVPAVTLGVLLALSFALPAALDPVVFRILMLCGIAIIMAVSLNLVNGFTGQFSIGHAGFQAVGAYLAAVLTVYGHGRFFSHLPENGILPPGWPGFVAGAPVMLVSLLAGGLAAAAVGYVVGLPSLRLRGDYLAIVTLGFGEIIRVVAENTAVIGGALGFSGTISEGDAPSILIPGLTSFFWVYLVVVLVVVVSRNLRFSVPGLRFLSVREDEVAAQAMGVDTTRVKVQAFVIGAFFAGLAGALYAHYEVNVSPQPFNFVRSFDFVTMVVLGGLGSITGSVLAAVLLTALPEVLRSSLGPELDQYRLLAYAFLLIVLMLVRPQGIFGRGELRRDAFFRRRPPATPLSSS